MAAMEMATASAKYRSLDRALDHLWPGFRTMEGTMVEGIAEYSASRLGKLIVRDMVTTSPKSSADQPKSTLPPCGTNCTACRFIRCWDSGRERCHGKHWQKSENRLGWDRSGK
jgi:hypothetical protein